MDEHTADLSPDEQKAEQEGLKEVPEDELRKKVAEEYGVDPESQSELLEKIVAKEKEHRKRTSGVIRQKIKYRNELNTIKGTPKPINNQEESKIDPQKIDEMVNEKVKASLEERDLNNLNLPDELKDEVRTLAQLKKISVLEAAKLPYVTARKSEIEADRLIRDATPKGDGRGPAHKYSDPSKMPKLTDFDYKSPEGRTQYETALAEWKKRQK